MEGFRRLRTAKNKIASAFEIFRRCAFVLLHPLYHRALSVGIAHGACGTKFLQSSAATTLCYFEFMRTFSRFIGVCGVFDIGFCREIFAKNFHYILNSNHGSLISAFCILISYFIFNIFIIFIITSPNVILSTSSAATISTLAVSVPSSI